MLARMDKYIPESMDASKLRETRTHTPLTDRLTQVTLADTVVDIDIVAPLMDHTLREQVHADIAPCSPQTFIDAYCALHLKVYEQEFSV